MAPQHLVDKFGGRIVFWGGGVDTQKTLPFGTPEDVRQEVAERLRVFGAKSGFVFNTVHNIQCNTPVQNVLAMFEALGRAV
jgi:uroporphyrinogen-III decarboxylase